MKKVIYILLLTIMLLSFSACGGEGEALSGIFSKSLEQDISTGTNQTEKNESQEGTLEPSQSDGRVDVDLTRLSSTMIYSEVYNMILTPENYIGKSVKMQLKYRAALKKSMPLCFNFNTVQLASARIGIFFTPASASENTRLAEHKYEDQKEKQ